MTLCIAAECSHEGRYRYVFAKDFAVETEIAKAEIEAKYTYIGRAEHPALMAGTVNRALELAGLIGDRLDSNTSDTDTLVQIARNGARDLKYKIADEYVAARLGLTYERLIADGARLLPSETYREIFDDIGRITLGCSLLWLAFGPEGETVLIRVNDNGTVDRCTHFAAIGSGYFIAEGALFQRAQNNESSLGRTIYHVYEAMKLGAAAPGVGKRFSMHIASPDTSEEAVAWEELSGAYHKYLETAFRKYGPKRPVGMAYRSEFVRHSKFDARGKLTLRLASEKSKPEP